QYNIEPLVHITCRDRNLIGLQSHLLGLSLLNVNEILANTGDPSKIGHLPGATNVYDVNSKGLTEIALRFNEGNNTDGDALKTQRCTQYVITQTLYSNEKIDEIYGANKPLDLTFFIGIMSVTSYNNALFLHNVVPGIKLSEDILEQFESVKDDKEKTKALSLKLSKELIDTVHKYFNGLYLITPFQKVDYTLALASYSQSIKIGRAHV